MSVGARLAPFTGTPIEKTDANTRAVFGDLPSQALRECLPRLRFCAVAQVVISIYDIQRAAAVPQSRDADLLREPGCGLNQSELPKIDEEFEAIIPQPRDEELTRKEKLKTKWAALEADPSGRFERLRRPRPQRWFETSMIEITDCFGRKVRLTDERLAHICRRQMALCTGKYPAEDAFVITAYLTDKLKAGERLWPTK